MNTSQKMGPNALGMAIANITALRSRVRQNPDNFEEQEILYYVKNMLVELNQYFGGGYCSFTDVVDNCGQIASAAMAIKTRERLPNRVTQETLDSMAYEEQREERERGDF